MTTNNSDDISFNEIINNENVFEHLFNSSADSIFINKFSREFGIGEMLEVNETMANRLNVSKKFIKGKSIEEFILGFNISLFSNGTSIQFEKVNRDLISNNGVVFEIGYYVEDDKNRYSEVRSKVVKVGEVEVVFSIARDVTERKKYDQNLKMQKYYFAQLFDKSPSAIAMIGHDEKITKVNESFVKMFEYTQEEAQNRCINDLIVYGDIRKEGEQFSKATFEGACIQKESIRKSKSGKEIPVSIVGFPIVDQDEKLSIYALYTDISKRKKAENKLRVMAEIFENNTEASMIISKERKILQTNKAFSSMTGLEFEQVSDKNIEDLKIYREGLISEIIDLVELNGKWQGELSGFKSSGEAFSQWFNMFAVFDENGDVKNYVSIFSDISNVKEHEAKINYLSYTDKLTNLSNKPYFKEILRNKLFTALPDEKFAVLFIDLDDFKLINENINHAVGDEVLKYVANEFSSCLREDDILARYGGDEFIILLNRFNSLDDVVQIGDRIIERLLKPININDMNIYINISIGVAVYPDNGIGSDSLIKNSEIAMNKAKEVGASSLEIYSEGFRDGLKEKYNMKNALRNALANNEIYLMYQPIIDPITDKVVGSEALARWSNSELGNIPPVKFIPLAEQSDEILYIGEWILHEACKQNKAWHDEGFDNIFVSVNISAKQLDAKNFIEILERVLEKSQLPPEFLELEITESVPMKNTERCIDILEKVKSLGIRISMDDFGTGYSSLSKMNELSLSKLKIDKYFIDDIEKNGAIISTIIAMANNLNLTVVAEGVESLTQLNFLKNNNCDMIQGYYYSKPLKSGCFNKLLSDGKL